MNISKAMNIIEYAKKLGVSKQRVHQWVKQGRLKPKIVDGHYDFTECRKPEKLQPGRRVK